MTQSYSWMGLRSWVYIDCRRAQRPGGLERRHWTRFIFVASVFSSLFGVIAYMGLWMLPAFGIDGWL
jgi:hypothetical protein